MNIVIVIVMGIMQNLNSESNLDYVPTPPIPTLQYSHDYTAGMTELPGFGEYNVSYDKQIGVTK